MNRISSRVLTAMLIGCGQSLHTGAKFPLTSAEAAQIGSIRSLPSAHPAVMEITDHSISAHYR